MRDTPRTDEEAGYYDGSGCWKSNVNGECVESAFARTLERELNAANERIATLEKIIQRARVRFCGNGSDGTTCSDMLRILDGAAHSHVDGSVTETQNAPSLALENEHERIARLYAALEECDAAFSKFCPDRDSRYGKAWASSRLALRKLNPFEPHE